jgi:hypothetical protein
MAKKNTETTTETIETTENTGKATMTNWKTLPRPTFKNFDMYKKGNTCEGTIKRIHTSQYGRTAVVELAVGCQAEEKTTDPENPLVKVQVPAGKTCMLKEREQWAMAFDASEKGSVVAIRVVVDTVSLVNGKRRSDLSAQMAIVADADGVVED